MAYSSTNPPAMISQRVGGNGGALWSYLTTDSVATVAGSSYFSDGHALAMKVGDAIHVVQLSTADAFTAFADGCVNAVTTGAGATVTFAATST